MVVTTALGRTIAALALLGLLTGCLRGVGSNPNLEAWVAEVEARPAPPLDPLPVMQQFETYEYSAHSLRDPFSTAFSRAGHTGPRPDSDRRKQPLEQFPLDGLKMVGTLHTGPAMVALVTAPDKVIHRVTPGTYLGQNDGRVTAIHRDRVELVELVPDGAGGWLERPASIALNEN